MYTPSLSDWLLRLEQLHPSEIDLGLDRVNTVADRLHIPPIASRVVTVAGTNGKGSTIELLSQILESSGHRVGCYTSPHLRSYNERVRIAGLLASDEALCAAFEKIDAARGDISLTYFEFGTLAALMLFAQSNLDVAILEVGLGGRLDAVNIVDPDVAILTTVALDHESWLGSTREQIGYEKAGIFRPGIPVICGHLDVPNSVIEQAQAIAAKLIRIGNDYGYQIVKNPDGDKRLNCWGLTDTEDPKSLYNLSGLAMPSLPAMNTATAIQAAHLTGLTVTRDAINAGLLANLTGRYQRINRGYTMILDVGHNPEAAGYLYGKLSEERVKGKIHGLLGILADKDSDKIIRILAPTIDSWTVAELNTPRTQSTKKLQQQLKSVTRKLPEAFDSIASALATLDKKMAKQDLLVVFGSFYTVNAALDWQDNQDQEQKL